MPAIPRHYIAPIRNQIRDNRERWGVPPPSHRHKKPRRWWVPVLIVAAAVAVASVGVATFLLVPAGHKSHASGPKATAPAAIPPPLASAPPATHPQQTPSPPTPSPSPTPSTAGAGQAASVNDVLKASSASRQELVGTDLTTCGGLSAAIPTIQKVVSERQAELQNAQNSAVDQLPSGTDLHTALVTAMQDSLNADQAYLAWANAVKGCSGTPPSTQDSRKAANLNGQAGQAKQQLLQLWAPIAQQNNLPAYADGNI